MILMVYITEACFPHAYPALLLLWWLMYGSKLLQPLTLTPAGHSVVLSLVQRKICREKYSALENVS